MAKSSRGLLGRGLHLFGVWSQTIGHATSIDTIGKVSVLIASPASDRVVRVMNGIIRVEDLHPRKRVALIQVADRGGKIVPLSYDLGADRGPDDHRKTQHTGFCLPGVEGLRLTLGFPMVRYEELSVPR